MNLLTQRNLHTSLLPHGHHNLPTAGAFLYTKGGLDDRGQAADTRTQSQRKALRTLLKSLHHRFPEALIAGHRDLSPDLDGNGCVDPTEWVKQCPSFNAMMTYWDLQPAGIFD